MKKNLLMILIIFVSVLTFMFPISVCASEYFSSDKIEYGDTEKGIKINGLNGQYRYSILDGDNDWANIIIEGSAEALESIKVTVKANTDIGSYEIKLKLENVVDNSVLNVTFVYTVIPKTLNISGLKNNQVFEYDGTSKMPIGTLKIDGDLFSESDLDVLYKGKYTNYSSSEAPKDVDYYTVTYTLNDTCYKGSVSYDFEIKKSKPHYDIPKGLIGVDGQKLSSILLPDGFTWKDENTDLIVGKHKYEASYRSSDENYEIVNNIMIEVNTKKVFQIDAVVNGLGGSIDLSKTSFIEDSDEVIIVTFSLDNGYMIDKLLVNNTEVIVENNKLELTNISEDTLILMDVKKIVYDVILGDNETYTKSSDNELIIRIDADYSLFNNKVYVDDNLIDENNYTSKSGSTIIMLKNEYVDTLEIGEHILKVEFIDGGVATSNFVVSKSIYNPQTSDNIVFYMYVGIMSFVGLLLTGVVLINLNKDIKKK